MRRTGSAAAKQRAASSGAETTCIGPSQTARNASGAPTAKKGGNASASRLSQALAVISGPIPAGSPSATARGSINWAAG